jgi:uncharacterized protein (DUF433 family)
MGLRVERQDSLHHDLQVFARQTQNHKGTELAMTIERIQIDPAVMMGKPVIRGTRITVELILRKLAEGESESELLEDYPHLTREDLRAAVAYGAASVAHEEVVLLSHTPAPAKS